MARPTNHVLVLATLLLCTAPPSPAQDPPTTKTGTVVCHQSPALTVQLCHALRANAGDPDWLAFEFVNHTDEPLALAGFSYQLREREVYRLDDGQLVCTGGLGQGHHLDLFGHQMPVQLVPGTTRITRHLRDQAAMQLGSPPKEGWRVSAKVAVSVALGDAALSAPTLPGTAFSFEWHRPDEAGLARMRRQLEQLLLNDESTLQTFTTATMLLATPDVGDRMELDLLLTSRPDERRPFHYWTAVLRHLDAHHAADPALVPWVLRHLRADDPHIVEDLAYLPHVWHDSFLPELVRLHELGNAQVLWLLERHGTPQAADPAIARRLSHQLLERLLPRPPHGAKAEQDYSHLRELAGLLRSIGRTGDVDCIERLTPWLDCRLSLSAGTEMTFGFDPRIDCHRICDAALEALLALIGDEGRRSVDAILRPPQPEPADGRRLRLVGWPPQDVATLDRRQDEKIATLKQYLAKRASRPK